jgi:Protein of unknown function (DUF3987)
MRYLSALLPLPELMQGEFEERKSSGLDAAWEPLQRAQKIDLDQWREQVANWKTLPKDKRDPDEPKPRRRLVSHDGTMEALQDILGRQDRGIGVFRDELSGWLGSLEKYAGAKASGADRAFFLQALLDSTRNQSGVGRNGCPQPGNPSFGSGTSCSGFGEFQVQKVRNMN